MQGFLFAKFGGGDNCLETDSELETHKINKIVASSGYRYELTTRDDSQGPRKLVLSVA